jgi:hypothetical protein
MYAPYSFFYGIWLFVIGVLAAPNIIVSRKPEAKEWIDKLVPFQGWMGVISLVWGIVQVVRFLTKLRWFEYIPTAFITWIVYSVCLVAIGILLGMNVIKGFVSNEEAKQKMDNLVTKLAPKQGTFGLISIIVGLWIMIDRIFGIAW